MTVLQQESDSNLVDGARRGDQDAFAAIYDRYADRLHSYCFVMLRNAEDAADATHETFVKAATKLTQLRNPDKLRPWLFAIARNEANAIGRHRARSTPEEDLSEALVSDPDHTYGLAQEELKELVWSAVAGLQDRDRELMTLHLVEGLEGEDLANAVGVSPSHLHVLVSRMRDRVEKALGALLIARLGREECKELDTLLGDWDGHFSLDVRSKVTRHVESCKVCRERRSILVAPANLLPSVVFIPAAAELRNRTLESATKPLKRIKFRRRLLGTSAIALVTVVTLGGAATLANVIGETPSTVPAVLATGESTTTTTVEVDGPPAPAPQASGDHSPFEFENNPPTTVFLPADGPDEETTTTAPTTTTSPASASLQLNVTSLNLGSAGTSGKVTLVNVGGTSTNWSSSHSNPVYQLTPDAGTLAPGASVDITISLNRSGLDEGDLPDLATFASAGNSATLTLAASVEVPPVIAAPTVSPSLIFAGGTCLQKTTTVTASVSDESDISTVTAWWGTATEPFIGSFAMTLVGGGYQGEVGPFAEVPVSPPFITIHVVAIDVRGNQAAAQAPTTVEVLPC
jgi:RNA polymerase sigma factor (sigma-70 family)